MVGVLFVLIFSVTTVDASPAWNGENKRIHIKNQCSTDPTTGEIKCVSVDKYEEFTDPGGQWTTLFPFTKGGEKYTNTIRNSVHCTYDSISGMKCSTVPNGTVIHNKIIYGPDGAYIQNEPGGEWYELHASTRKTRDQTASRPNNGYPNTQKEHQESYRGTPSTNAYTAPASSGYMPGEIRCNGVAKCKYVWNNGLSSTSTTTVPKQSLDELKCNGAAKCKSYVFKKLLKK